MLLQETEETTRVLGALCQDQGQRPIQSVSLTSQQHTCMPFPPVSCSYSCSLGSLSNINYLQASLGLRFYFLGEHRLGYQLRRGPKRVPQTTAQGVSWAGGRRVLSPDKRMEASWGMCPRHKLELNRLTWMWLSCGILSRTRRRNWSSVYLLGRIKGQSADERWWERSVMCSWSEQAAL